MQRLIFINLPVQDLGRSVGFYESLGGKKNAQFSDETAACIVLSDVIHVMLLTHNKWSSFTDRAIPDAQTTAQVMLCISAGNREEVDQMVDTGGKNGGQSDPNRPVQYPFMYSRSLADPDGHIWEVMWMDLSSAPATPDSH